jgi:hypothetical protein
VVTLQEAFECPPVWAGLVSRYPELHFDPRPTIDELVVVFLRQHDVFVKPVGSNINASPIMSGVMGGLGGPMAVGMNQALTAQAKGVALQEWTSWKQWTLNHDDWPEFSAKVDRRYKSSIKRVTQRLSEADIQECIKTLKEEYARSKIIKLSLFLLAGIFLAVNLALQQYSNTVKPTKEQPSTVKQAPVASAAAQRCREQAQKAGEEGGNQYFAGARADTDQWAKLVFEKPDGTQWETDYGCE